MVREEGHYTIKRVKNLPKKGNSNWLYILNIEPLDKMYRWSNATKTYEILTLGYSHITDFSFDIETKFLSISIENGNTSTVDLTFLSEPFAPKIIAANYSALLLEIGQSLFEFAEVINSEGVKWLPGTLGGTYKAAGLYYWNGISWVHDNDAILKGLQDITNLHNINSLDNRVVVKQNNVATTLGGEIDSSKEYFIDGVINIGSIRIEVPANGISIKGYNFNISKIISTEDNYSLFSSAIGGSGDILWEDLAIEVSGINSKVLDLEGSTGNETFEISRINFNNCSSLGEISNYRQGLEKGTGRYGGTPNMILSGTWAGGYYINTSIVRGILDGNYSLFEKGASFLMYSRFRTNQNVILNTNVSLLDFSENNFPNSSTLQIENCIITRNGVMSTDDINITPNITASSIASLWKGNLGLINTFVGGDITVVTEQSNSVTAIGTFYDIAGTFTTEHLQHIDSPTSSNLRYLGDSPKEFRINIAASIESAQTNIVGLKIVVWDSSTSSFIDYKITRRTVNQLSGNRDIAYFTLFDNITLDKNDYVKFQVANFSTTADITVEESSVFSLIER